MIDFPDPGDRDVFYGIEEINKNNYSEALKHFEKGSNYGNQYALLFSAVIYFIGSGLRKREPAKTMNLCKKVATEWNNPVAQYLVGSMYFEGDEGVPKDIKAGVHWISLAAESAWPYAIANLGEIFYEDLPSSSSDAMKAISWFEKLAKKDDSETQIIQDKTLYLFGAKNLIVYFTHANQEVMKLVEKNSLNHGTISPVKALRDIKADISRIDDYKKLLIWNLLTEKQSSGVLACEIGLSKIYSEGKSNVPVNHAKALYWSKMGAKYKNKWSYEHLILCYQNGLGVKQNHDEVLKWCKKICDLGSSNEALNIAANYFYGDDRIKKNSQLALVFLKLKVSSEDSTFNEPAYLLMGDIYRQGTGNVPLDYKAAYGCYKTSSDIGVAPTGPLKIAALYCKGLGVKRNQAKAIEWVRVAASKGCVASQSILFGINKAGFKVAQHVIEMQLDVPFNMFWRGKEAF